MSMSVDRTPEMGFRQYTGEPNRRGDLESFGLVRPGLHPDIRTATITMAGQERTIRVTAVTIGVDGDSVTVLRPIKADFRRAVREFNRRYELKIIKSLRLKINLIS